MDPDDRTLLRWQRNEVFQLVQEAGLDPAQLSWQRVVQPGKGMGPADISRLALKETGFYFDFGCARHPGEYNWSCGWMPTAERRVEGGGYSPDWTWVLARLGEWLAILAKETSSPDLWQALASESLLVNAAAGAFDDNEPFTRPEKRRVVQVIHELSDHLKRTAELSVDQLNFVEMRLAHLQDAAGRLGRKDWITLALGALTSIVIGTALSPEAARELFSMAGHLLSWIAEAARSLP